MKQKRKYTVKAQDGTDLTDSLANQHGTIFDPANDFTSALDFNSINNPTTSPAPSYGKPTSNYNMMPFVDWHSLINLGATGVTAFANTLNSNKEFAKQQQKYYQSLRGTPVEDNYVQNDNPIYTKYGGMSKYPYGGGPLTAAGAKEILRDGTVHGKPLTAAQKRYFGYIAGGGSVKKKYGGYSHGLTSEEFTALNEMGINC